MRDPSLLARLEAYASSGALPMHMPGHKRNLTAAPFLAPLSGGLDITEIDGFDNLHDAQDVLRREMERAAALWGARRSFFLVNGSTCGLLAAVYAVAAGGGTAIVARNCHKAVYHALELCGLTPRYLLPDWCAEWGIYGSVSPESVAAALADTPNARFVLLTSPTFEGALSDISAIAKLCHQDGVPLLVDEAHGAHLGLGGFPAEALACGADVVIQSAHKTLPSLTQTALLHVGGTLVDDRAVARALNIFETSSPSYLLMASLSGCVRWLEEGGPDCFSAWRAGLAAFDEAVSGLTRLRVTGGAGSPPSGVFGWDGSKRLILSGPAGRTGPALMDALRRRYAIELEMSMPHYALAMTGAGDTPDSLLRLARALTELDREAGGAPVSVPLQPPPLPPVRQSVQSALARTPQPLPLEDATGRVCAQYLWAYPPGVPLLVPGEEITAAFLEQARALVRGGVALRSPQEVPEGKILVLPDHAPLDDSPFYGV